MSERLADRRAREYGAKGVGATILAQRTTVDQAALDKKRLLYRDGVVYDSKQTHLGSVSVPQDLREAVYWYETVSDQDFYDQRRRAMAQLVMRRKSDEDRNRRWRSQMPAHLANTSGKLNMSLLAARDETGIVETLLREGVPQPPIDFPKNKLWREVHPLARLEQRRRMKKFQKSVKSFHKDPLRSFEHGIDWMELPEQERMLLEFREKARQFEGAFHPTTIAELLRDGLTIPARAFGVKQGASFTVDGSWGTATIFRKLRMCIDFRPSNNGVMSQNAIGICSINTILTVMKRLMCRENSWDLVREVAKKDLVVETGAEKQLRKMIKEKKHFAEPEEPEARAYGPRRPRPVTCSLADAKDYYYLFGNKTPKRSAFAIWNPFFSNKEDREIIPEAKVTDGIKRMEEMSADELRRHPMFTGGATAARKRDTEPDMGKWEFYSSDVALFGSLSSVYGPWSVSTSMESAYWKNEKLLTSIYVDDHVVVSHRSKTTVRSFDGQDIEITRAAMDMELLLFFGNESKIPFPEGKQQAGDEERFLTVLGYEIELSEDPTMLPFLVGASDARKAKTIKIVKDTIERLRETRTEELDEKRTLEVTNMVASATGRILFQTAIADKQGAKPRCARIAKICEAGLHANRKTGALADLLQEVLEGLRVATKLTVTDKARTKRWLFYSDAALEKGVVSMGAILYPPDDRQPVGVSFEMTEEDLHAALTSAGWDGVVRRKPTTHIGVWEAIAALFLDELIEHARAMHGLPDDEDADVFCVNVDNLGSCFALTKGASDCRFSNAIARAFRDKMADKNLFFSYIFSERNPADALTRKEILTAIIDVAGPAMSNKTLDRYVARFAGGVEKAFFANFEDDLEKLASNKREKKKRKMQAAKRLRQ